MEYFIPNPAIFQTRKGFFLKLSQFANSGLKANLLLINKWS